jgi:tetratricopeptide (TPR) repeat protein
MFVGIVGTSLMKFLILLCVTLSSFAVCPAQQVTVTATTDKKEVAALLAKEREASRINQAYFSEDHRCRDFLNAREWAKAESSCRAAVLLAEKLPKEHVLERSSIRGSLAIALLWQGRSEEAVSLLNKSLEISKPILDDTDAEKGDIYLWLGHAHRLRKDTQTARDYYERAERTYRSAFVKIGDDELRFPYGRRIRNIVEAHLDLVTAAGLVNETEKLQMRLADVEKEFAKYLAKEGND